MLQHTTHVFQPLDVVIFHPLKSHFSGLTQHIKLATLGWKKTVNCCKTNFTKLFKKPWESMSTALIKTGFRKCSIYPLNRNAINKNRFTQDKVYSAATATTPSSTTLSDRISMQTSISRNQPDERWLTSDKYIRLYEEKVEKIRKDNEAKEKRKAESEQRKIKKNLECKRGGVRTRGGLTHQRTQRQPIQTCRYRNKRTTHTI